MATAAHSAPKRSASSVERRRGYLLLVIMAGVALGVIGIALAFLYAASFEQQQARLVEIAESRARLIEAIAREESGELGTTAAGAQDTLAIIREAHAQFVGFGDTGEFTLAERRGDEIVFLLRHRHGDVHNPPPIAFQSVLAEPMRRALSGKRGTLTGIDYRGEEVLAAHEPVTGLGWGIVAKIDVAEVRRPFVMAGSLAGGAGLGLILIGMVLFLRIGGPMIRRLETSLADKDVLLREIHHRVKNNLQVVGSLLALQAKGSDNDEVVEALRESELRLQTMALIHKKLYGGEDLAHVDFHQYLDEMLAELSLAYRTDGGTVVRTGEMDEVQLGIDQAVPCAQIVTELVSNALKHAFPGGEGGTITVGLTLDDEGRVRVRVADDGVGFPEELDFRRSETLGLRLVSSLAQQLDGSIEMQRSSGTCFTLTFELM